MTFSEGQRPLHLSAEGFTRLKSFEGFTSKAVQPLPGDRWTIAWGHTRGVKEGMTCNTSQASQWLLQDVIAAENLVYNFVTVELNQNQFDGLTDGAFNLGEQFFRNSDGTKTRILEYVNSEKFHLAAEEFLTWDHFRGKVNAGLLTRRTWESHEFEMPINGLDNSPITSDDLIAQSQELISPEGAD